MLGVYMAAFKQTAWGGWAEGGTQIKSKPGNPEGLTEGVAATLQARQQWW